MLTLVLLLPAPAAAHHRADPSAPSDFRNADASTFGAAQMQAYRDAPAGDPVALSVPLIIHPEALTQPAFRYLFGFNVHGDAATVTGMALTHEGKPVPVERDETDDGHQPRVIVQGGDLPRDGPVELLLTGMLQTSADGRVHVGALAIAFDAGWGTLRTEDGGDAQAYAFTLMMVEGHATSGLAPRFQGEGNSAVAMVPLAVLAGLSLLGLRAAWRRLHPAKPKAPAAPAPVPTPSSQVPLTLQPFAPAPRPAFTPAASPPRPWAPPAPRSLGPPVTFEAIRRPVTLPPVPQGDFSWAREAATATPVPREHRRLVAVKRPKRAARVLAATTSSVVARTPPQPAEAPMAFEVVRPMRRR